MDRKTAVLISMGFEIVGIVLVAIYVGGFLDEKYALAGMGVAGSVIVGFIGWLTHIIMVLRTLE